MIYLIEDKTSRRNDYGWSNKRIKLYKDAICVIDCVTTLLEKTEEILLIDNILLYHESFVNSADCEQEQEVENFLNNVENKGIKIAFFSGSKSQRTLDNNVCNLPPHVMYANLEHFIKKHADGDTDFKYLMFGKNPDLEDKLRYAINEINVSNVEGEKIETSKKLFFFIASDDSLDPPYENIDYNDSFDFECDDTSLSYTINQNLNAVKYDGIYIPLCFGETLSDFMGLRLAMLIRFTKSLNWLTPIIIYGEAGYQDMISNECFDILKMPGIYYTHSDYQSINDSSQSLADITVSDYNIGLNNIHLNIPSDIGDNHSVSNKWAIHQWAHALNISEESDFDSVEDKVINSLYFKYLVSLNSLKKHVVTNDKDLVINFHECKDKPKVLFVDDQANEGWYEALCYILNDRNDIGVYCLGEDWKQKTSEEIINEVTKEVKKISPDIVILDLRLCTSDFGNKPIKDLTGNRVLRTIKQMNRGIQVLIFSSTSKIWNYQFLTMPQEGIDGADGFIVKERPEDSKDSFYTRTIIKHFVASISQCCNLSFRKKLWEQFQEDIIRCNSSDSEYGKSLARLLELAEDSLFAKQSHLPYASIFINLFRVVEATANEYVDDFAILDSDGQYYFQFKDGNSLLKFDNSGQLQNNEIFKSEKKNLPYLQKICNTLHHLGTYDSNTYKLVEKRNDFIHPNVSKQKKLAEFGAQDVLNAFGLVHNMIKKQDKI
ncbi:MAG: hypothetical protein J6Y78_10330 [Paludibacteraceae bacterium]|nr:hypothetical protein [Paludibacteraceae bacterium]